MQRTCRRAASAHIDLEREGPTRCSPIVAANVPEREVMMVPGMGPKMTPAVMVSGMAGTASTSSPAYTTA